jgi:hypothetical protein
MTSQILAFILPELMTLASSQSTVRIRLSAPLRVSVLEKKDGFFVTDGFVIAQALTLLSNPIPPRDDLPKPLNRIRTHYYNFGMRTSGMFLFTKENCGGDGGDAEG